MELSHSVFAGLASGSLMGVLFLGVAAIVIVSQPQTVARLSNSSFRGFSTVKSATLMAMAAVVVGTIIGAVLGLAQFSMVSAVPGKGIGSPAAAFTCAIIIASFTFVVIAALKKRQHTVPVLTTGLCFALVFGWLLPWLAY
ncbi:MAG: hypothetical protein Q7O66_12440 [Dehalococcoidia bacterium]|nr:hypothetical protein [Dehalococcoidia bacterium]